MSYILIFLAGAVIARILMRVVLKANGMSIEHIESESDDDDNSINIVAVRGPDIDDAYGRMFNYVPFEDDDHY